MTTIKPERYPELSLQQQQSTPGSIRKTLDTAVQDDPTNGI